MPTTKLHYRLVILCNVHKQLTADKSVTGMLRVTESRPNCLRFSVNFSKFLSNIIAI